MDIIFERLKEAFMLVCMILISAITPIANAIIVLMMFFTINIITGYKADLKMGFSFSLKKAFDAIKLLAFYYSVIFVMHIALSVNGEEELALTLTKWVTLVVCYFYLLNVVRNAIIVFPNSKSLPFFYKVLKVEVYSYVRRQFGFFLQEKEEKNKE